MFCFYPLHNAANWRKLPDNIIAKSDLILHNKHNMPNLHILLWGCTPLMSNFVLCLTSYHSQVRMVAWWNGFEVLKATIFVITFVWICRTLHVGVWSQRPGGKGQEPALCEGLVEVQQLSFERWGQMIWWTPWLDKAPRLSISIVIIWILSSDTILLYTICQLNQFITNSEAAMLSNRGPDDWDITEWRLSNGIFSLGQNQGEAGTPAGGSHHSRLVINQIANYNYKTKQLSQLTGKRDWSTGILSSQLLSHRILTENWCNNWSGQFI